MRIRGFLFDKMEFAGSLGDLGTLIPLSIALIVFCGLSVTTVFLMVGAFYILSGLFFNLPIPVQPLKVVSAIAIAFPERVSISILAATGLLFGGILIFLSVTGIIDWVARLFTRPIIRGIQLALGFILIEKGLGFIIRPELFLNRPESIHLIWGEPINPLLGVVAGLLVILLINNRRFPAALFIVAFGLVFGLFFGSTDQLALVMGPTSMEFYLPSLNDFWVATTLLLLPQIPLTIGNAVIGTTDTCLTLYGNSGKTERATNRLFSASMGLANIITGLCGGMPMCHGSGGVVAHHRFGARTGGSNVIIGTLFLVIALAFGKMGIAALSAIPNAILGTLLLFAGVELAVLIRDIEDKNGFFVAILIAGIGFATSNISVAFVIGISLSFLIKWRGIQL